MTSSWGDYSARLPQEYLSRFQKIIPKFYRYFWLKSRFLPQLHSRLPVICMMINIQVIMWLHDNFLFPRPYYHRSWYTEVRLLVSCLSIRPFGFFPNPFQQAISNLVHLFGGNYTTCSHFIGIGSILPTLRPKADCFFNHVFINQDKSFKYVTFLHLFLFSEYVLRVFGLSSTWLQTSVWKFLDMCGVSGYKSSLSVIYSKPYFILMQFVSFCPASNYGY